MNITIQVLSTQVETKPTTKGSYQQLEIAYKDLSAGGKVASKKLMSFSNKKVFDTLATSKPGTVFEISMEKNDKNYWDWVECKRSEAVHVPSQTVSEVAVPGVKSATHTGAGTATKGGWETPEERAKKQIYIVRQSSLGHAVATLTVGRKSEVKPEEVIELAKKYEDYVFSTGDVQAVVSQDLGTIETIPEDIPF